MPLSQCMLIDLQKMADPRGNLVFIEANQHIPFPIKRIYYLYDIPANATRAGHGHKQLQQLIIAVSGSFTIHLDDGHEKKSYLLNNPAQGLYICPMVWREIDNFSPDAVCLVLASLHYDEEDYYREYSDFSNATRLS
jgi:dTDP-4-dehydrorhamnose 3,5-epimerase-like enzyme